MTWKEFNWKEIASPIGFCKAYRASVGDGELAVIVGQEPEKWHLSISHTNRLPVWSEIKEARYEFVPDKVTMAMILPPKAEYVNLHPTTMHLYEID